MLCKVKTCQRRRQGSFPLTSCAAPFPDADNLKIINHSNRSPREGLLPRVLEFVERLPDLPLPTWPGDAEAFLLHRLANARQILAKDPFQCDAARGCNLDHE